jgi:hypothetical protein
MMSDITLTFGKYQGKKLSEIRDRSYIVWLAEQAIRKQPEAPRAAQEFLREHPMAGHAEPRRSQIPGPAPQTSREARKLSWMASKGYGNAKATLLAARDKDGFLAVVDEEDDDGLYSLLWVSDNGMVYDAAVGFSSMSYSQVEAILARYPQVAKGDYLVDVVEREKEDADEARRRLVLRSQDGKHEIVLLIWDAHNIDVTIDGCDQGLYRSRAPDEQEQRHPRWKAAAAILETVDDPFGNPEARKIGLLPERKRLIEQKIQEVTTQLK